MTRDHRVLFYEDESTFFETVAEFLREGIDAGEQVVVVARPAHAAAFSARLGSRANAVTVMDAEATLERFMDGDMPDVARFLDLVGRVRFDRAYGEMVDVLWERGNRRAAIALEGLWNDLAETRSFSLFCAYSFPGASRDRHGIDFDAICWAHTETIMQRAGTSA